MTGALLGLVGLMVVGLPLLAVVAGRRFPEPRDRPGRPDPALVVARAHGVGGIDVLRMQEAVEKGEQVAPALRPATVAWAEHQLAQRPSGWSQLGGRRRWLVLLAGGGYVLFLLIWAVSQALDGDVGIPLAYLVALAVQGPLSRLAARRRDARARAAITLNSADPVAP